jgi:hypothetical protein
MTAWCGVHGLAQLAVSGVLDGPGALDEAITDVVALLQHGLASGGPDRVPADHA